MTDGSYDISQADLQILGAAAEDKAGTSVSTAGDIDGDERFDFLIGAPFSDLSGNAEWCSVSVQRCNHSDGRLFGFINLTSSFMERIRSI